MKRIPVAEVREKYAAGATVAELAAEYETNLGVLGDILGREAVQGHRDPRVTPLAIPIVEPETTWTSVPAMREEAVRLFEKHGIPLEYLIDDERAYLCFRPKNAARKFRDGQLCEPIRQHLRALWLEGVRQAAIAARLGVSQGVVTRYTRDLPKRRMGKKRKRRHGPVPREASPKVIAEIRAAWKEGARLREIVQRFGVTYRIVLRSCADLPRRKSGPKNPAITKWRETIRVLWLEKSPLREIAAAVGCSTSTVQRHTRDLPRRRPPTL